RPEQVVFLSGSSWWPLIAAGLIMVLLACFMAGWYGLALACLAPLLGAFCAWAWTTGWPGAPAAVEAGEGCLLPSQYASRNAPGWWAVVVTMLIIGSLFASLVFAYFYLWLGAERWPPAGFGQAGGWSAWLVPPLLAASWVAAWSGSAALRAGLLRRRRVVVP